MLLFAHLLAVLPGLGGPNILFLGQLDWVRSTRCLCGGICVCMYVGANVFYAPHAWLTFTHSWSLSGCVKSWFVLQFDVYKTVQQKASLSMSWCWDSHGHGLCFPVFHLYLFTHPLLTFLLLPWYCSMQTSDFILPSHTLLVTHRSHSHFTVTDVRSRALCQ